MAASPPRVILFLGNSITAGYGIDPDQAFPALIQEKIDAKSWNFKVVNAGQSGDTSAGGLNRLDWLLKNRVDILILELGANDGLRGLPPETTRQNLQAIIERTKAKYPETKVIVAGRRFRRTWAATTAESSKQSSSMSQKRTRPCSFLLFW